MKYLVNSSEMKQYDLTTTGTFHVPSLLLMERAALAVSEAIASNCKKTDAVLVVCGAGNNGADGLAAARILLLQGFPVDIVFVGEREKTTVQWKKQEEILLAYGFPIFDTIPEQKSYALVADAVFGVGLTRNIEGRYADVITTLNALDGKKLAVDIASGISADTGAVLGVAFCADLTVTFAFEKLGMYLWPGNQYTGQIVVAEIGITKESFLQAAPAVRAMEQSDIARLPKRPGHSNKGTFGKLLLIAGSVDMAGAAILSARAAYTAGCGLVCVYTPMENRIPLQTCVPEAVLLTYDTQQPDRTALLEKIQWTDAIVCGPGLGKSRAAQTILETVLSQVQVPVVLDADALNLISEKPDILKQTKSRCIVTPHLGEMGRLTKKTVAELYANLPQAALDFAAEYGAVCVLKDEKTVIATPEGDIFLNLSGNNGMATAGSGDVLSGITGALCAQKMEQVSPLGCAAVMSAFLHGCAGDRALSHTGYRGMTADDIIDGLRELFCERQL